MTADGRAFDFDAMKTQGDNARLPLLFVLVMTPLPQPAGTPADVDGPTALERHYEYMHRLIDEGKLLLGGPCLGEPELPDGPPVPPGLVILRVDSRAEAEDIAHNEPFHLMGWRRNTVLAWTVKFGSVVPTLQAHF